MNEAASTLHLSRTTQSLHWLVAFSFLGIWGVGYLMVDTENYGLYQYHKQAGIIITAILVFRAFHRLHIGWPPAASQYQVWEQRLAKMSHWLLLLVILLVPITGMLYSGTSGHGFSLFGQWLVKPNMDPSHNILPYSENWSSISHQAHWFLSRFFLAIIAIHVLGALKHHFIDRDCTLTRMIKNQVSQ